MKKTITLMMLFAIAGSAKSDLVKKIEGGNSINVSLCPGMLTKSGKAIVYTYNESSGEVTLYTPDFEVDRTFAVPMQEYTSRSFTEQATVTPTGMNIVPTNSSGYNNYYTNYQFSADSQEDMISKLAEQYGYSCTAFIDPMDNPACYRNDGPFKYENVFGKKYPTEWYALIDGIVYQVYTRDAFYTLAYDESTAVWEVTQEETDTYNTSISSVSNMYAEGIQLTTGIDGRYYFTQTLFNDDDKWECIMGDRSGPVVTTYNNTNISVNEDGTVTITRSGTESQENKYAIYSEDGTKIGQLESVKTIHVINGKACVWKNHSLFVFESDDSGNIDLVEKVSAKNDRSLETEHGIVTVDIDTEQAGGEVVICTTDGRVMASKKVGVGQTQINDWPLPTGIYVVSLLKDGRVVESEKYLVQ